MESKSNLSTVSSHLIFSSRYFLSPFLPSLSSFHSSPSSLCSPLPSPQKVEPSVVKLLVMENLMLIPSMDVYILIFSFVDYHIQRRKHGRIEMVPLPSNRYSLSLSNSTVGELNPELSRVTGLVLGYTEVIVEDQSILSLFKLQEDM